MKNHQEECPLPFARPVGRRRLRLFVCTSAQDVLIKSRAYLLLRYLLTSMVQSTKIGDERASYLNRRTSSRSSLDDISD